MKYCAKIFLIALIASAIGGCNIYKKRALLACNRADFVDSYNQYKMNRDKSVKLFAKSEADFAGCDQKFANAFDDIEQKNFVASLDRANRFLAVCKDDMKREANYNAPWFMSIASDDIIKNYEKYKELYPSVRNFDIDGLNKCLDYYKHFEENQKRKEIVSKNKENILMRKYGYKLLWDSRGLYGLNQAIDDGDVNIAQARKYLIKKDNLFFDPDFVVDEVVGNLIVYVNLYDKDVKIVLQRYKNELYARQSSLNGDYFVVVGTKKFTINDKATDVLIFKKIL